jgi:hypothetical protein
LAVKVSRKIEDTSPGYLGVERRSAENYSKTYEAMLKQFGLTGKMVDAESAIFAICDKLLTKGTALKSASGIVNMARDKRREKNLTNHDLARLMEQVIFPAMAGTVKADHLDALRLSDGDLKRLAFNLKRDYSPEEEYVPRFYEEIRVTATQLDGELERFKRKLTELTIRDFN